MERLVMYRRAFRAAFTKAANQLEELLQEEPIDRDKVEDHWLVLKEKHQTLKEKDQHILDCFMSEECEEEDLTRELNACESYNMKFIKLNKICNKLVQPNEQNEGVAKSESRKFKLPVIEFRKFSGNVRDWLSFWAQFNKIHTDENIDDEDKFQYLLQATVTGSRARAVVESFPPTKENYCKVIESLRSRFGREEMLVEVYVRELLTIVLNNFVNKESKISLDALYDQIETKLRSLETLGVTTDKCAAMLFPLVESCLPADLLRAWQRSRDCSVEEKSSMKERLNGLMRFLKAEVENEARISIATEGFGLMSIDNENKNKRMKHLSKNSVPSAIGLLNESVKCVFCEKEHKSEDCHKARKMTFEQKRKLMMDKKVCFRCLKQGHLSRKCRERLRCVACDGPHYVLLCPNITVNKCLDTQKSHTGVKKNEVQDVSLSNHTHRKVLLQTLRVKVLGENVKREVRAIIDSGSQKSYIVKSLAEKLEYHSKGTLEITHSLFGGVSGKRQNHNCYEIRLANLEESYRCKFDVLDQPIICSSVQSVPEGVWLQEVRKHKINITDIYEDEPIEVLIGADVSGKLFTGKKKDLDCGLVAIETSLGWTLQGKIPETNNTSNTTMITTSMFTKDMLITDLWQLDVLGITDPIEKRSRQQLEEAAQEYFQQTISVTSEGRYQVALPWVEGHPVLRSNFEVAEKRLQNTLKKLRDDDLLEDYNQVFEDWLHEGFIEETVQKEDEVAVHYLPHRPVVKNESNTTRIRPVFDASSRVKNHPSLNHCLEKGPNLIELIPKCLLRFRLHKIGVTSDIKKAFMQIEVHPRDRDYLRFLWVTKDGKKRVFRHRRVVFGVCASPFLLGATLKYHLEKILSECERNESGYSKKLMKKLMDSFYVDNCVTSVENEVELKTFIQQSTKALEEGAFEIRGWEYTEDNTSKTKGETPILGLMWRRDKDTLFIQQQVKEPKELDKVTKRYILSQTQSIFDPIGFTCPATIVPKLMLQKLWSKKISWDEEVDEDTQLSFRKWQHESNNLNEIKLPRWLNTQWDGLQHRSLHVFCDASSHAYAAVVFLRVAMETGVQVHLIQAKARVAPIKKLTIPRLELLACTIGARLYAEIKQTLNDTSIQNYFWSDSSTAIYWIQKEEDWAVFVGNRVKEIRKLTEKTAWRHIPGILNPADLPSRGCNPKALLQSQWWEGPSWLFSDPSHWPSTEYNLDKEEVNMEKKNCVVASIATEDIAWYGRYFSKFLQIVRHIAWIYRFLDNCKHPEKKKNGELTTSEVERAEFCLIRLIQKDSIDMNDKKIASLRPFIDEAGVIRLRTKIANREDFRDFLYPILLPTKNSVVERLIFNEHVKACHAGTNNLMNILRERYWILGGRRTVRKVLVRCVICRRQNAKNFQTLEPSLPLDRVKSVCTFEVTGIDFAGPLYMKNCKKAWICLFTCGVYRAVHLELVTNLSTDGFLQALRRFIARRGRPKIVYSDNGTNFIGANNSLSCINWVDIEKFSSTRRIHWKFNPPSAPWWGGWWERMVRTLKQLLKKTLGRSSLTYEGLLTVLCDCEAVINSRPITYLSDDPRELRPITPKMFLQEQQQSGVEDFDQVDRETLQRRAQYREELSQHLRKRFRSEYLGQLRQFNNKSPTRSISVGEVVLIGDDVTKRIDWPLGRVEEIFPGQDGQVRLVRLRTANRSQLLRSVQRLYPLEVCDVNTLTSKTSMNNCDDSNQNRNIRETEPDSPKLGAEYVDTMKQSQVTKSGRLVKVPDRLIL